MTTIGYARVSTDSQTLDAQDAALREAGCAKVFAEKQSGAKTDRAQLAPALAALASGDTLVVCKLDRLARSTRDLLNTLAAIAAAGATFRSLSDGWANTDTPHGKLMVTILAGLAEFERHLPDPGQDHGRQGQSSSSRSEVWRQVEAHRPPAIRGLSATRCRRGLGGDCEELQRQSLDYIEARRSGAHCLNNF